MKFFTPLFCFHANLCQYLSNQIILHILILSECDEDIQTKGHSEQELDQVILDLGEPMTRGRLKKAQETLQHKVANILEAQMLNCPQFKKTLLITCTTYLDP